MGTRYQIHVILIKVETDKDGECDSADILEEEEHIDYREDIKNIDEAHRVYNIVTGNTKV